MPEAHLDFLPIICRPLELRCAGERTGIVSRRLVWIAQNAALRLFRTAFRLQRAGIAIRFSGDVAKSVVGLQGAGRSQNLAVRTGIKISLALERQLQGLCDLLVSESLERRCGGGTISACLCEVVVVLAIRTAIAVGTVNAGLLAGLAHPELHTSLVAMHDEPARNWQIRELAWIAGMSRGHFIQAFKRVIGRPPATYLSEWRMALARVELRSGRSFKSAAASVGFGSAAAFSRAYSRAYGYSPSREGSKAG